MSALAGCALTEWQAVIDLIEKSCLSRRDRHFDGAIEIEVTHDIRFKMQTIRIFDERLSQVCVCVCE